MADIRAVEERGYRHIDHTADVGIEAWGPDFAAAFAEAALGLAALMVDPRSVTEREERCIAIDGDDIGDLLVRWLSEIVALVDSDGLVFCRFEVNALSGHHLEARAFGEPIDATRHRLRTAVKAVTYHALSVDPGPPARVSVIVDL
jgi:SHS2 domain-containing protein